ncbi:hypothetical protein LOD99_5847 [Oopsacas minuta]|uniref:Uncharacterized protein n=1 Tax=Oopsacas minuta TaxID=111878 RepID=A0AAV7JPS4_9METZ|nr:hypothetical protein LOD99_5847 [Oopsacas minuta]
MDGPSVIIDSKVDISPDSPNRKQSARRPVKKPTSKDISQELKLRRSKLTDKNKYHTDDLLAEKAFQKPEQNSSEIEKDRMKIKSPLKSPIKTSSKMPAKRVSQMSLKSQQTRISTRAGMHVLSYYLFNVLYFVKQNIMSDHNIISI